MLSLGIGLIPAALCAGWLREALTGRASAAARRLAVLSVVLIVVLFAATMFAQGGWLDTKSEERYYLYAIPLLWIGAIAALELRDFPARWVAFGAGVLAALLFVLPITVAMTSEQAFLGPVSGAASKLLGTWSADLADAFGKERVVTPKDLLGWIAVAVALLGTLAWRRARWLALVPAVVLQLGIGAYAFATLHGSVDGVGGITGTAKFADLAWVDRALPSGESAVLLDNQLEILREGAQRMTAFWNADVHEVVGLRGTDLGPVFYPVDALGKSELAADEELRLAGAPPSPHVVSATTSPFWQVAGRRVRGSADGSLSLLRVGRAPRLTWRTEGLDPDGQVVRPVAQQLAGGHRVAIRLAPAGPGAASVAVALGGRTQTFASGQGERTLTFDACSERGVVAGTMSPRQTLDVGEGRQSGAIVLAVRVEPC